MTLDAGHVEGDADHVEVHNEVDAALAALAAGKLDAAAAKLLYGTVLVYTSGAYPARPSGAVQVKYIGPVQPTTWLPNDEWLDNS